MLLRLLRRRLEQEELVSDLNVLAVLDLLEPLQLSGFRSLRSGSGLDIDILNKFAESRSLRYLV